MGRPLTIKPVATIFILASSTPITTAAWSVLSASIPKAASYMEIFNSTGSTFSLSKGAPGSETLLDNLLPYTVLQGGSSDLIPLEISNGKPLSLKALDQTANTGIIVINLFA